MANSGKIDSETEEFLRMQKALTMQELLQIPKELRNLEHCKVIIDGIKNVKFLERYMDSDSIYDLAREMILKRYGPKERVFTQGDEGDNFYIILEGSAKVYINTPSEVAYFYNLKEIMKLQKGDAFGELALIYDSQRSATIMTEDPCDMIVLNKDSFRKHIRTFQTEHIAQIIEFFKEFVPMHGLTTNNIALLASKALVHRFPSNTIILRQNELPGELYYIKSGRMKVIRRILFKCQQNGDLTGEIEDPSQLEIQTGRAKSMVIDIDELSNGDSFGDYSIIHGEPMHYTVITIIPTEVITLPCLEMKAFPESVQKQYKAVCKTYPPDSELRKIYFDIKNWDAWKKTLVENIQIEKYNKKTQFGSMMRKPAKRLKPLQTITVPIIQDELLEIIAPTSEKAIKNMNLKIFHTPEQIIQEAKSARALKKTNQTRMSMPSILKGSMNFVTPNENLSGPSTDYKSPSELRSYGFPTKFPSMDYNPVSEKSLTSNLTSPRKFDYVAPKHRPFKKHQNQPTNDDPYDIKHNFNEQAKGYLLTKPSILKPMVAKNDRYTYHSKLIKNKRTSEPLVFNHMEYDFTFQEVGLSASRLPPVTSERLKL